MINVINKSNSKRVGIICARMNELLLDNDFWAHWLIIESFNLAYTDKEVTAKYLRNLVFVTNANFEVYTFQSRWPWSKSNGYTLPNKPGKAWLNTRRFNRSDASIVATIIHEIYHYLDVINALEFNHGDNVPKLTHDKFYNGGCVQEVIADLAYEYLTGVKSTECSGI